MAFLIGPTTGGNCCDPPCPAGRVDPCECDCCDDLPAEICVWCWETETMQNSTGCCTQPWSYSSNCTTGYLNGTCEYRDQAGGAGELLIWYDQDAGFWRSQCYLGDFDAVPGSNQEGIRAEAGCAELTGYYYSPTGDLVGGVGTPKAGEWGTCDCPIPTDPPCDCLDEGGYYIDPCVETNADPCCDSDNRKCPETEVDEGIIGPPTASCACP